MYLADTPSRYPDLKKSGQFQKKEKGNLPILAPHRHTIKPQIQNQPRRRLREFGPPLIRAGRLRKVGRVGPATDRKQDLQPAVPLLEQEQLLDAPVYIGAGVIPRVTGIVFFNVGP